MTDSEKAGDARQTGEWLELNDCWDGNTTVGYQMDLTDAQITFHPKAAGYIFFASAHETLSVIDHMLDHKISICKCKKLEVILNIFSNHSAMRQETSYKKKTEKKSGC